MLPTRALSGKTPYELLTGRKPDLSLLRIFGSLAHMRLPNTYMKKLDDRSRRVVNLGCERGTKGCRLYDPKTKKIWVSRDVVFRRKENMGLEQRW